ncbi:hypothetical protein PAXINDRAFT_18087 [Paxillus involutus ATCC 200175]|uniref:Uncharacterized protein n=1 Tax=Paxillus involutus ATCC 200175 TaxID=664439 RepID=A0A0C9TCR5_PAXIN|nr:hypothetical protein PAXINDRAFT_18087 [Paxillus involutus ATCC 200175]
MPPNDLTTSRIHHAVEDDSKRNLRKSAESEHTSYTPDHMVMSMTTSQDEYKSSDAMDMDQTPACHQDWLHAPISEAKGSLQATRKWDDFLQGDGRLAANADEQGIKEEDIQIGGNSEGDDDEVESGEEWEDGEDVEDVDERDHDNDEDGDRIQAADEDEELDDNVLAEGFSAL